MQFWNIKKCRRRIGGEETEVHSSTVYRMIAKGLWPKPVHPSPGISRWIDEECEAALAKLVGRS
jgi:predicted DNA-binding transcriptional regulator AlpA